MDFFEVINRRISIRSFKDKKIEKEKLENILNAITLAPSAGNLQAYKVCIVTDKKTKNGLYEAALQQEAILEAPVVLVFFAVPKQSSFRYGLRGNFYSIQDATIACTFASLAATALNLSSVWIGAFNDNAVKTALNAPEDYLPVAILPIGYQNIKPLRNPRKNLDELTIKERFS